MQASPPALTQGLKALSTLISDSRKGNKTCTLVLDTSVASLLHACNTPDFLSSAGCTQEFSIASNINIEWKGDGPIIFLLSPKPSVSRAVASQIRTLLSKTKSKPEFKAIFVPRRSFRCEEVFREENVLGLFQNFLHGIHLGFVPLPGNSDILTLESPDFLYETKILGDTLPFSFVSRALLDLGPIKHVRSKGYSSKEVLDLYLRMQKECGIQKSEEDGEFDEDSNEGNDREEDASPPFAKSTPIEELVPGGPLDLLGGFPRWKSSLSGKFPIDTLILLDRELDMVSPLATPLTYESQLDECFGGLQRGFLHMKSSMLKLDEEEGEEEVENNHTDDDMEINLREDSLFREICNLDVPSAMRVLSEKVRELSETQERVRRSQDLEEMQEFVRRVPELQLRKKLLTLHIALGKRVSAMTTDNRKFRTQWHAEREMLETLNGRLLLERAQDSAARGDSLVKVLRLLCLNCILAGGYSSSALEEIRRDLIHAYGYETMFTLEHLERAGLLTIRPFHPQHKFTALTSQQETTTRCVIPNWAAVRQGYNLISEAEPHASVFSGMVPLSVRLVEMAINPGWDAKTDLLKLVGDGPTICRLASESISTSSVADGFQKKEKKTLLVMFLGGVSYAEIASLRLLGNQPDCPFRIVIGTTSVLNGNSLIKSFFHQLTPLHG